MRDSWRDSLTGAVYICLNTWICSPGRTGNLVPICLHQAQLQVSTTSHLSIITFCYFSVKCQAGLSICCQYDSFRVICTLTDQHTPPFRTRALLILPPGLRVLRSLNRNRPDRKESVGIIRAKYVFFLGFVF